MKKISLALSIIAMSSMVCTAQESDAPKPNPSDMTQVNTFAYGQVDGDDIKAMIGIAGAYSEGNTFMGLIEHGIDAKSKKQNSRLRYFQVLNTHSVFAPQAGVSIDYMKNYSAKSDVAAVGVISKVLTPFDALTIYPNLAYVTGQIDTQSVRGYQANLFASLALGESGDYLVFQPQYMNTNIGTEFKVKTGYGAPLDNSGKIWWDIGHEYQHKTSDSHNTIKSDEHKLSIGLAYYF